MKEMWDCVDEAAAGFIVWRWAEECSSHCSSNHSLFVLRHFGGVTIRLSTKIRTTSLSSRHFHLM